MKLPRLLFLFTVGIIALVAFTSAPVHLSNFTAAASPHRLYTQHRPFFFEQNVGQTDPGVQFIAHGTQYDVLFRPSGMVFKSKEESRGRGSGLADQEEVFLSFAGARAGTKLEGSDRQLAVLNYYVGTDPSLWHSSVPTFARVHYQDVYPGVDLVFYAENQRLEFDVQIAPGSDPRQIHLRVEGTYSLSEDGDVLVGNPNWIRIRKPRAYQIFDGQERDVIADYVATDGQLSINVGEYDPARRLILDPVVLYQGFVPDTGPWSFGNTLSLAADAAGNAYLAGLVSAGLNGPFNCAITKIGPTGTTLYQTLYGPVGLGNCNAIAADGQGNAYITGLTFGGIPVTHGVVQSSFNGGSDAFAAKFTGSGQLAYGTYLGGSGNDAGAGIAVDINGNAYLTGSTSSNDFPIANAFQSVLDGPSDAFVSVLNSTASGFLYSTYLGGNSNDQGSGIAADSAGEALVMGTTNSTDFPLKNPLQSSCGNPCRSSFLTKFDANGSGLVYSTYLNLPGGGIAGPGVALDQSGNAFAVLSGSNSVTLESISPSGTLNFSQSLTTSGGGTFLGVAADMAGNAYFGGDGNVAVTNPLQPSGTSFVASYTNSGTLIYATPVDGTVTGLSGAEAGNVYIAGSAGDNGNYFSVNLSNPVSTAFVSKISAQDAPALAYMPASLAFGYRQIGVQSQPQILTLKDLGTTTLDLNSIVVSGPGFALNNSTCGPTLAAAGAATCTLSVTFTPVDGNPAPGAITITDNSSGSPHVIQLTGQGAVPAVTLNPTSLSFPDTIVGQSSQPEIMSLTNTGHATLTISRISISGDFSETNTCGSSLSGGQNCSISVTFTPTTLGSRVGTVTIADNASNSPQTVPLSGTGISGALNLQPSPGDSTSATVQAGQAAAYQLSIGGAGFSGMASLSCTGAPTGANCSLPSSMSVNASTATPFNVQVTTTSQTMGMLYPANLASRWLWATSLLFLVILPIGRGKKQLYVGKLGVPILLLLLISSCGGGSTSNSNGTPAGTYQLTVAAKSGSIMQSMPLTLKVE